MMKHEIITAEVTPELKTLVNNGFSHHAKTATGLDALMEPVAFVIRDNDEVAGVCIVQLFWGNLHVKNLFVCETYRSQGLGSQLMEHAFEYGKDNGCHFAFVETMSFQAPEFYKKLGFEVEFKRDGYTGGNSFYYLKRNL